MSITTLVLLLAAPAFIFFTKTGEGPGAMHAHVIISLAAGLLVGILAQRTRLCMVGGIRDLILFRESKLILGFLAIFLAALVMNIISGKFVLGFANQPIAHTDGLWNFLGMLTVGFGSTLLGGCPLRQLILAGEGNTDSAITIIGLFAGAAFAHNFALASSAKGPTFNGMIAVIIGLITMLLIAVMNTKHAKA
jgi:YedE family putative selenium metabolism protein